MFVSSGGAGGIQRTFLVAVSYAARPSEPALLAFGASALCGNTLAYGSCASEWRFAQARTPCQAQNYR